MGRSPTTPLYIGLVITLAAVVAYSAYVATEIRGLRQLQNHLIDRNRKDSLQLLRIQNGLNSIGMAMRDMLDTGPLDSAEQYPLTAWRGQFERMRGDLEDAFRREKEVSPEGRTGDQQHYLESSLGQFWDAVDRVFQLARTGKEQEARDEIRLSLQARLSAISTAVARLLVENNESEERAAEEVSEIYDRVARQAYVFLTATLAAILLTSLYLIRSNRLMFNQLAVLSGQRSDLAQKLISSQESTLRHISRELHDDFGQILTAIGIMLGRAGSQLPSGSALHRDLVAVREAAQTTLDKVRSLSQALHPVMLEEAGLEPTIEWYLPVVERQTGIGISYEKSGTPFPIDRNAAVHIYRVLQEALNNVVRHSGAKGAGVRLRYLPDGFELEVEDHGSGFSAAGPRHGIGLVAMRERAQLLGGEISIERPSAGGTLVRIRVPRGRLESNA
ncbi:MAG: sensor histidine kinase [Acidobacteria bacterium]|nr:sensor histidine kinase [Acidobacteriota bacterium]